MAEKSNAPELAREQKTPSEEVRFWLREIAGAKKREREYRKEAKGLIDIYEGEVEDIPYNILYSNTETLAPAVYNVPPRPDVRPRNHSDDPTAMAAAGLVDSYLLHFIDSGDPRYCTFDESAKTAVSQSLVPGRGLIRLHYKADVAKAEDGSPERVTYESVFPEPVDWDQVLFGYAKSWSGVPWVAFIHTYTREEAEAELGKEKAAKLTYERPEGEDGRREGDDEAAPAVATVYEIWHKATRKVIHIEAQAKDDLLEKLDDPYVLQNFFPMAEPLQLFRRISCFLPVPLYRLYKKQAAELNKVTRRIDKLIDAMKVRGFYDSQVEGMQKLFESEENTLLALQTVANLGQGAKAENAIWLVPIEKHVAVLQQLFVDRQQIKVVIFEIMGIADIMRGQSQASETLGAQEIKNRWGTLRLKRAQGQVGAFLRDTLRVAAELAFSKLGPETLRKCTGSELPPLAQVQLLEQQAQMSMQGAGQPPSPQLQQAMAIPAFEECLALLKSDLHRNYTVDIETNSTIDAEATEDKQNLSEFLNALAQFLNGVAPLMESGLLNPELLKVMLVALTRRFHLGRDLDDAVKHLSPPQGGGAQNAAALKKAQAEVQKAQQALGQEKKKLEGEKMALEKEKLTFAMQQAQGQAQAAIAEAQKTVKDAKAKAGLEQVLLNINTAMAKMQAAMQVDEAKRQAEAAEDKAEAAEAGAGEDD